MSDLTNNTDDPFYAAPGDEDLKDLKVLVVEDDPETQFLLTSLLRRQEPDWNVESVSYGHKAVGYIALNQYDVVLMDYQLPDMSGLDVIKIITKQNINTPVIVLTGNNNPKLPMKFIQSGARDFLTKEFGNALKIVRTIKNVVQLDRSGIRVAENVQPKKSRD